MSNIVLTAGGDDEYQISRSVRLRSSASAYFNRTPAVAGSRTTFTFSFWLKRGALSADSSIFGIFPSGTTYFGIGFGNSNGATDSIEIIDAISNAVTMRVRTAAVLRDPSAWYHIVVAVDTTQATASNRCIIYINGVAQTALAFATYPAQNSSISNWNTAVAHHIGVSKPNYSNYFDGYLTEVNFIDGQALTPSSLGETDSITGVWKPKKYAGTYGTNGFYLNFSDNSSNTATTIGKDNSGNGNNWTPNNISVTSGVTYDSMIDSPTMYADGGNGRGNYPTLNPLFNTGILGYLPLTNANLTATDTSGSAAWRSRWATIGMTSGKWYAEFPITYSGSASVVSAGGIGIGLHDGGSSALYVGQTSTTYGYHANAVRYNNASSSSYGATFANGDVIGVAYDADAGTLTFYKNGTSQGVAYSSIPAGTYFFSVSAYWVSPDGNTVINANFGQRPFAYTPPTGFKALNTQNLPDATIKKGNAYFDTTTWTGNSSTQNIANSGAMQPDFVWIKDRSAARSHRLFDAVRGATKGLFSDATDAETTLATDLTAFNSNGFALGAGAGSNATSETYVGWQWKESVSAGFDIVTYTGDGIDGRTVSHALGVAPKMVIVKNRAASTFWYVFHSSLPVTYNLYLNSTAAQQADNVIRSANSTTFTVSSSSAANGSGQAMVAYLFSEVAGFSKFGSYTGNGSTDGPFVYLGFRPRFILIKSSSAVQSWHMIDTARDTYNLAGQGLDANTSAAEYTPASSGYPMDILSNGFKIRYASEPNVSGATYIYAAFAENPFKNSLAR